MELYEPPQEPQEPIRIVPKINHINLIHAKKAIIELPERDSLSQLQLIFSHFSGKFLIEGVDAVRLGNIERRYFGLNLGIAGFETQPKFIYNPKVGVWHFVGQGRAIYFDSEDEAYEWFLGDKA